MGAVPKGWSLRDTGGFKKGHVNSVIFSLQHKPAIFAALDGGALGETKRARCGLKGRMGRGKLSLPFSPR
jgi:hypothetical protein